jgi:predicted DNA-binding protein
MTAPKRRGPGRPRSPVRPVTIGIRLPPELAERLQAAAKRARRSVAAMVAICVETWLGE